MTPRAIAYWATTALISLAMLASGVLYLSGGMTEPMGEIGYPAHFVILLGTWKALVAPALLAPGFETLKQWTYAGLFFTLTGAAWAHLSIGDGIAEISTPLVMLALAAVSWGLHRQVRFGDEAGMIPSFGGSEPVTGM